MSTVLTDYKLKVITFLKMAECLKTNRDYQFSNRLYKKALEYVWLMQNDELEVFIYDKLGQNYFLIGNMEKAQYFH